MIIFLKSIIYTYNFSFFNYLKSKEKFQIFFEFFEIYENVFKFLREKKFYKGMPS